MRFINYFLIKVVFNNKITTSFFLPIESLGIPQISKDKSRMIEITISDNNNKH